MDLDEIGSSLIASSSACSSGLLSFHGGDSETVLRRDQVQTLKKKGKVL